MDKLIEREKQKYNELYLTDTKYGWKSGRPKTFLRTNDAIHNDIRKALRKGRTLLDVGCGRGFFVDMFKKEFPNLNITCIDIAAKEIKNYRPDLKIIEASSDNIPFQGSSFDVVTHLDGMEHIPVELEEETFIEELRVTKKYIYHQIATHGVARDKIWIEKGLGAVHINMKTAEAWNIWFNDMCIKYGAVLKHFVDYKLWVHVLLEKVND